MTENDTTISGKNKQQKIFQYGIGGLGILGVITSIVIVLSTFTDYYPQSELYGIQPTYALLLSVVVTTLLGILLQMSNKKDKRPRDRDKEESAEQYLNKLAGITDGLNDEYVFEEIEVPDAIARAMRDDPRINIVDASKGKFGLNEGTMILSYTICPPNNNRTEEVDNDE